jgi:hypothetical protein
MTFERFTFEPEDQPIVFTADLCALHTECENHHALCKGIDHVDGTGEPVFCTCWCHQKASVA